MNLIIFFLRELFPNLEDSEGPIDAVNGLLSDDGPPARASCTLPPEDARVRHALEVLNATSGDALKVGVVNVGAGTATVHWCEDGQVEGEHVDGVGAPGRALRFVFQRMRTPRPRPRVDVMLAMPRPQILKWLFPVFTQMGVSRIVVTSSTLVPKNYWMSRKKSGLTHEALYENIVSGMQQGADPRMPELSFEPDLKRYLRTKLAQDFPAGRFARIFCDLGDFPSISECINEHVRSHVSLAQTGTEATASKRARAEGLPDPSEAGIGGVLLAIGPERGWTQQELDMIREHSFSVASMGPQIMRTDVASIASVAVVMQRLWELMETGHHDPIDDCKPLLEAPPVHLPTEEDLRFISFYKESWKPKQKAKPKAEPGQDEEKVKEAGAVEIATGSAEEDIDGGKVGATEAPR